MARKHRKPVHQPTEREEEKEAIESFFSEDLNEETLELPAVVEESIVPLNSSTVDNFLVDESSTLTPEAVAYLKSTIYLDLYQTDQPSKHDREVLALKERSQRYARRN